MASARDLATRRMVAGALARSSSGRVIATFVTLAAAVRLVVGSVGWIDLVALAFVVALLGPVEWIIHRTLLHARPTNRIARLAGTRDSHERHHRDPDDIDWLLLRRPNAIFSCVAVVAPMGLLSVLLAQVGVAASTASSFGSGAAVAGLVALLHYEWVHLLVHSRYRPQSRYYARLDRHHRLHHFRDERSWLGVTIDTGDRLFRTLPIDVARRSPSAPGASSG